MPSSECDIQIGQKRLLFIDGLGDREGMITKFDEDNCWLQDSDNGYEWEIPWGGLGPMTHIGILVDGEEYKKYMADVETQALEAVPDGN